MASLGKRDFAKRDMNFFSEFTASSQAFARAAGWIVIVAIGVVAATVLACIYTVVNYGIITSKVKAYDEKFATPEYVNLKTEAQELQMKQAKTNKYSYVMQTMQTMVEKETGVEFNIVDNIDSHIPYNVIVTDYTVNKNEVIIKGQTHDYYAPTEMINLIKENLVIIDDDMQITRVDPSELGDSDAFLHNYVNAKYSFEYKAKLVTTCAVKITCIGQDNTVLTDLRTEWINSGDVLTLSDLAILTVGNDEYKLDSIMVNGLAVSAETLINIQNGAEFKYGISNDTKVDLYYVPIVADVAGGEQ